MAYQTYFNPYQNQNAWPMNYQVPQGGYPNQFQTGYIPTPSPTPNPTPSMQPSNTRNEYDWVQGDSAAKAYMVLPGQSMILMDSDSSFMYQKSVDANGKPMPLKYFKIEEVSEDYYNKAIRGNNLDNNSNIDLSEYVRKDELMSMITESTEKAIEKKMGEMSFKATTTPAVIN